MCVATFKEDWTQTWNDITEIQDPPCFSLRSLFPLTEPVSSKLRKLSGYSTNDWQVSQESHWLNEIICFLLWTNVCGSSLMLISDWLLVTVAPCGRREGLTVLAWAGLWNSKIQLILLLETQRDAWAANTSLDEHAGHTAPSPLPAPLHPASEFRNAVLIYTCVYFKSSLTCINHT